MTIVTAEQIAKQYGLQAKWFRQNLRQSTIPFPHDHYERWAAPFGSGLHHGMLAVAEELVARRLLKKERSRPAAE
jgi:hypothetical protein